MSGRSIREQSGSRVEDVVFLLCKHLHNPFWVIGVGRKAANGIPL